MPGGLTFAIALLAQASSGAPAAGVSAAQGPGQAAPPANPPAQSAATQAAPGDGCRPAPATIEPGEIFVCAPRPQGYRIDPDVMEAKRQSRSSRPKRPERMRDTSCASVGPFGCTGGAGIDILGAAMVAGAMATRAVRGENVGSMFITDPQPTEYQLYLEAKRRREAKEAEAAAANAAKARAAQGSNTAEAAAAARAKAKAAQAPPPQ